MLTILIGKSASGKDTLLEEMKKDFFIPLVSITSRPMRDGEQEGREYHFITKEQFEEMIRNNGLLEYRSYNTLVNGNSDTWYYGSPKLILDTNKNYITILDVDGAKAFKDFYGPNHTFCVYISSNDEIRKERATLRSSFDETEWNRRLIDDTIKFSRKRLDTVVDFQLYNNSNTEISTLKNCLYAALEEYTDKTEQLKQETQEKINDELYPDEPLDAIAGDGIFNQKNLVVKNKADFFDKYHLSENFNVLSAYCPDFVKVLNDSDGIPLFYSRNLELTKMVLLDDGSDFNQKKFDDFYFDFTSAFPNLTRDDCKSVFKTIIDRDIEKSDIIIETDELEI